MLEKLASEAALSGRRTDIQSRFGVLEVWSSRFPVAFA